ncbi:MAG: alpha/beta fold hydrolase [Proteobacteria bacterium]|nr:alpha/beta fold hydrolase [Pseudomonadota bacterium]
MTSPTFPRFRARAPWWGPDLQTMRNALRPPVPAAAPGERLTLPLLDGSGDALSAILQEPANGDRRATVVLCHGLGGEESSAYLETSARHLLGAGHRVVRLNLRGAGPSRALCRLQYHAGRTGDLRDALLGLDEPLLADGLLLVGFSLGGNMLLKFAAEFAPELPVRAVVSVSAPIDLLAASQRFLAPRNRLYQRHILDAIVAECFGGKSEISASEARAVRAARSIYEFDERFVAPRNGYASAEEYYEDNRAERFLGEIRLPALVVHALDDPWIPPDAYQRTDWQRNPNLVPLLSHRGGHVGFHGRGTRVPWHDRCIRIFFDSLERGV